MDVSVEPNPKITATFPSTCTPPFFIHPAETFLGKLGMITQHDLLAVFSSSGKSKPEESMLEYQTKALNVTGERSLTEGVCGALEIFN